MLLNSIIIVCIIVIVIYFTKKQTFDYFTTVTKCTDELEIINIKKSESPKILILSGIHGNEYAPPIGVKEFIEKYQNKFKKGNLFFIPTINKQGLEIKERNHLCKKHDMNRQFGKNIPYKIIDTITKLVKQCDIIIDFHEGYDFHIQNPQSIGSTIIPNKNKEAIKIGKQLVKDINNTIKDKQKHFVFLQKLNISNSLRWYLQKYKQKQYLLIELTGIDDKQPLEIRVSQTKFLLIKIFKLKKII